MDISIDKARLKQNYQCTLFLHMTSKKLLLTVFSGYGHIKWSFNNGAKHPLTSFRPLSF